MIPADGRRVRAAVLGSPVGHSLSPVLHMAAYAALGLTWWRYDTIECDEAGLPAFLDRCGPDWAGLSLTMPLKRAVLPLLDRIEPLAADIGAANTVLLAAAQRLGYNTDAPAMVKALAARGVGSSRPTGPALIIGGGATACTALAALGDLGERSATALVRDLGRAGDLRRAAERLGMSVSLRSAEPGAFTGHRLIISTVPVGGADFAAEIIPGLAGVLEVVLDVVYYPWPTRMADSAARAEMVVVGGFELLLHQAALQVELMTGRPAPLDQMRKAGLVELAGRSIAARPAT